MANSKNKTVSISERRVLSILSTAANDMGAHELVMKTGMHYQTVNRALNSLAQLKCIKKIPAREGHKHLYRFLTFEPNWPDTSVSSRKKKSPVDQSPYHVEQIARALYQWSTNGFHSEIRDKVLVLPRVIGKLAEFDALSSIHGESISQSLIDEQREYLIELRDALLKSLTTVERMLATESLWKFNKLSGFFTSLANEPEQVEDILTKAKSVQAFQVTMGDDSITQS